MRAVGACMYISQKQQVCTIDSIISREIHSDMYKRIVPVLFTTFPNS